MTRKHRFTSPHDATLPPAAPEDAAAALMAAEDGAPMLSDAELDEVLASNVSLASVLLEPGPELDALLEQATIRAIVQEPGRDVAGKPSTVDLEDLLAHYGMEPEHVTDWKGKPEEGLVVVTAGGEKITWPQDIAREIAPERLTGVAGAKRGRVFPTGYLRRDASKDPKDA